MNAYRFLPPTCWSQQTIYLPTTEDELLRLAITLRDNSDELRKLFRDAPSVLLYAANEYFLSHQYPPQTVDELNTWFAEFAIQKMRDQTDGWSCGLAQTSDRNWPRRFLNASRKFSVPDDNRRLRKSLVRLTRSIPFHESFRPKAWIRSIIGKQIKGRQLKSGKHERRENVAAMPRLAESVMDLVCRITRLEDEFQAKLHEARLNAMKQLAYGASHEINNPLANVATRAQGMIAGESNPERRRKLAVIFEQAMRAHEMISDLMLFAHPPQPTFELGDVYRLVKQVTQEMRSEIRNRCASVNICQYPGVENIWLDKTQIAVVVKALLKNSLEALENMATTEVGKITIRIWRVDESWLEISFTDNGMGVNSETAKHMFDPFFSGREAGRGLGFGLSKAWRICQLHQGQLVFNREYADGAQFILRLPTKQKGVARIDNASAA